MITYVVRPGDTLAGIAQRFGVSVQEIVNANNLTNLDYLIPGQVLRIPAAGPARPGAPRSPIGRLPLPVLRRGSVESSVVLLQLRLRLLGYYRGDLGGIFGSRTERAVRRFQRTAGLPVNGVADAEVWTRLLATDAPIRERTS